MSIEARLSAIEERNSRVTQDKAWETSFFRKASIAAITYVTAAILFLFVMPQPQWYFSAGVPVAGYLLSTLSLPWIRKIWEAKNKEI